MDASRMSRLLYAGVEALPVLQKEVIDFLTEKAAALDARDAVRLRQLKVKWGVETLPAVEALREQKALEELLSQAHAQHARENTSKLLSLTAALRELTDEVSSRYDSLKALHRFASEAVPRLQETVEELRREVCGVQEQHELMMEMLQQCRSEVHDAQVKLENLSDKVDEKQEGYWLTRGYGAPPRLDERNDREQSLSIVAEIREEYARHTQAEPPSDDSAIERVLEVLRSRLEQVDKEIDEVKLRLASEGEALEGAKAAWRACKYQTVLVLQALVERIDGRLGEFAAFGEARTKEADEILRKMDALLAQLQEICDAFVAADVRLLKELREGFLQALTDADGAIKMHYLCQHACMANETLCGHAAKLTLAQGARSREASAPHAEHTPLSADGGHALLGPRRHVSQLLPSEDVYNMMKGTKVMFSFGSRRGGLDLSLSLRKLLLAKGMDEGMAYIDMANLKGAKDTAEQRCTDADGNTVVKVLNPHWAEYYYMGLLCMTTFVVILDEAWMGSKYTMGEWELFLTGALSTLHSARHNKTINVFDFKLVVVYDVALLTEGMDEAGARALLKTRLEALQYPVEKLEDVVMIAAHLDMRSSKLIDAACAEQFVQVCLGGAARDHWKEPSQAIAGAEETEWALRYIYNKFFARLALKTLNNLAWWQEKSVDTDLFSLASM